MIEPIDGQDATIAAAVAESWHVDGFYERAATLWSALPTDALPAAERELKVASALLSLRRLVDAEGHLDAARQSGAAPEEIHYARGRGQAHLGWDDAALAELDRARAADSRRGRARNMQGVVLWRAGDRRGAAERFALALRDEPNEPDALVNHAIAQADEPELAEALLCEAIKRQPHRHEAFVALSRLLRTREPGRSRDLLSRGRLRSARCGAVPPWRHVSTPAAMAVVRAVLDPTLLDVEVTFTFRPGQTPRQLVINIGYQVLINGMRADPSDTMPADVHLGAHCSAYDVPDHDGDLIVHLTGVPGPPAVRLTTEEIELDGVSGWLPIPTPAVPVQWKIHTQTPNAIMTVRVSDDRPVRGSVGLIATRIVAGRASSNRLGSMTTAVGRPDGLLLGAAVRWAERAETAWRGILGQSRAVPPLVVVDRPRSRYAYARQGYIRLASGMVGDPVQVAQVAHEVGHLRWGVDARFQPRSGWLAEGLAQFTYHLLEDSGVCPGHRARTLDALSRLDGAGDPAPRLGLARLAARSDRASMFALRAKGAFVLEMMRAVMGDEAFGSALRTVSEFGQRHEIDEYTFFAVASWFHGASLRWFVNQWVYADSVLELGVGAVTSTADGAGPCDHTTTVEVWSRGPASCGARVEIEVVEAAGHRSTRWCDIDSGVGSCTIRTQAEPAAVIVDPRSRFYAFASTTQERDTT